ncbi:glycerate kinase [Actinomyces bowdenii]|uniref:glycerate kinase n=1 Tax=Actinomyces bowdenii TaxID=131109 RepID=UPI001ABC123E|nr:glycerate kinase [Actinomyces bowdenii]MBO3725194.1 glycerate kinase [Actinomyces bowdenii]
MRVVIAPDSFKESMSAPRAAAAMARGVRAAVPRARVIEVPMSDGGEGFTRAVAASLGARLRRVETIDALGRPTAGLMAVAGTTAVMEMATCCGLELIEPRERDILGSDTRGVGRLIRAALDAGARRILLGIGGSATNDGGAGMLAELGVRLLGPGGRRIDPAPRGLASLERVDASGLDARLASVSIEVACDVDNPLLGPRGASAVFGPQKGAGPEQVARLDEVLAAWARLTGHADLAQRAGAGAAGGLGFALMALLGARLVPGVELVARAVGLEGLIAGADLVLTGEGSVDAQTLAGKTPAGVARIASARGVPTVVLAGRVGADADALLEAGCLAVVSISQGDATSPAHALEIAEPSAERAAASIMRLWAHRAPC